MKTTSGPDHTRRRFLKTGGAILVTFAWGIPAVTAQQATPRRLPGSLQTNRSLISRPRT